MPSMSLYENSDYTAKAVLTLGMVPGIVGLNSILRPGHALSLLGFPVAPDPEGQKLAQSLVQMSGARNLTMSLTTLAIWFTAGPRTLGFALLAGTPVALIDGFVSRKQVQGMEWGHWVFVPLSVGLGACLVGWI